MERRVLLHMATAKDAELTRTVLHHAGIDSVACADIAALEAELARGAGVLMLAEETLSAAPLARLTEVLARQAPWSDVCCIVIARQGADSRAIGDAIDRIPNVTVIERPVRVAALVSTVRSTLRARDRQYQVRSLFQQLLVTDQRKTEFLATLAHELRNPLAPLSTTLDLMSRAWPDAEAARHQHALMRRQIDHMVRLVNDLMEVSRITRGKVSLQRERVSLDQVFDDAIEQSGPLAEAAGHEVVAHKWPAPLFVMGDRMRLTQVFCNLLNNATKFMPAAGTVTIASRVDRDSQEAVVTVADSGIGLEPHALESIFEMFVQVGDTSKSAQGGLGIGLTLVKSLVEEHGGTVRATSPGVGRGSTFIVRLPLCAQDEATQGPPLPARADGEVPSGQRVLVVDDNRDAADSLTELLKLHGLRTCAAYSGEQALQMFVGQGFDAALLDIGLPGMDGCELARRLKAQPAAAHLKLIAITGWGQDSDRQRLAAAGFDHHLLKPVDMSDLMRLL